MNRHTEYSDEHISAYIDGELDHEERTRLLCDEQCDIELAQRISDVRMLKEKVQLAYSYVSDSRSAKKPFSCTAFVSQRKPLVASLLLLLATAALFLPGIMNNEELILARQLIKNTTPIAANTIGTAIGTHKQVVINVSQYQPQTFGNTIDRIETLLQQHSADSSFSIEIVANKHGLEALDTETSEHAVRIEQLAKRFDNLAIVACAKSLATLARQGNPIRLMQSIMITPSAAEQVAKRTAEGWLYLKI